MLEQSHQEWVRATASSLRPDELRAHHFPRSHGSTDRSPQLMSLTTTILGKRKSRATPQALLLQLSASDSNYEYEQDDGSFQEPEPSTDLPQTPPSTKGRFELVMINGSLVKNTKKKYHCTFPGCEKSYSKPCRLEEHERSHTGEVGFPE